MGYAFDIHIEARKGMDAGEEMLGSLKIRRGDVYTSKFEVQWQDSFLSLMPVLL